MIGKLILNGQPAIAMNAPQYVLGRGEGCDILLPDDDPRISRRHALLEQDAMGTWSVSDLGSTNGTQVNGAPVTSRRTLSDGDQIAIGKTVVTFVLPRSRPTVHVSQAGAGEQALFAQPANPPRREAPEPLPPLVIPARQYQEPRSEAYGLPVLELPTDRLRSPQQPNSPPASRGLPQTPEWQPAAPAAQYYTAPDAPPIDTPRPFSVHASVPPVEAPRMPDMPAAARNTQDKGTTLALVGGGVLALAIFAHFAWVQPHLEEFQSGAGQLSRGVALLFGQSGLEQQYTTLVWESRACILAGLIGGMILVYGLLKRR